MNTQKKIAALYCRFSREDENDDGSGSNSIKNQVALLTGFAKEMNLGYEIYTDDGYSGTMFDRPDFKRMIRDIENGIVGTVIVKDLSRLGRNYSMAGYYTDEYFVSHGIRLISLTDNIDSDVKEDEFLPIRNVMNDWYAKDISKKTKASLYIRGKSGKPMITSPIYGYKYGENNEWVIDEPAAEIVRRIFKLYLSGKGMNYIARLLTEEGVEKPRLYKQGKEPVYPEWARESIRSILQHQEYCGDTVNFKTLKPSYKSKKTIIRPKEENMVFPDTHEAIITREQYADAMELMEKNKRQLSSKSKKETLFRGFLICADCRHKMAAKHTELKTGITTYYVCSTYRHHFNQCTSHSVREKLIVDRLEQAVKKLIEMYQNGELEELLNKLILNDSKKEEILKKEQLAKSNERLEELNTIVKSLYEDKVKGIISNDMFVDLFNKFKAEQESLQKSIYELSSTANASRDDNARVNRFLQVIKKYSEYSEAIDSLDREVLMELIDCIAVGERVAKGQEDQRQVDIYFRHVGLIGNFVPKV